LREFAVNIDVQVRRVAVHKIPNFIVNGEIDHLSIRLERIHMITIYSGTVPQPPKTLIVARSSTKISSFGSMHVLISL
jgi:hypothetical protein